MKQLLPIVVGSTLLGTSCELKFGDDIELTAPKVTAKEIVEVTQRTEIQFPIGTTGLGYVFFGSGIDDALAIKVLIPNEKQSDFLKNDLFQSGNKNKPSVQIGRNQVWWKLNELNKREDYTKQLPQGKYVACSFGKENGKLIAYISWMST
ncbi:MAG: hypothetical protein NZ707_11595 [Rhodospirillales bacterium]|nr:hypothetical protein [Rhodospirillales bacterium]